MVLLAYAIQTAISYLAAPVATFEARPAAHIPFFRGIADALFSPGSTANQWLRGASPLLNKTTFAVSFALPGVVVTGIVIALLVRIYRRPADVGPATSLSLLRWSVAFAVVSALAVPVLVSDFWLSVAWGRVMAAGGNPYYEVGPEAVVGLPLESPPLRMTYGPLWAIISAAVMFVARGSALWGAVLFKMVLAGSWLALLGLLHHLMKDRAPWERAVAMLVVGWFPIGVLRSVAEGHNDVVLVACVLAWLAMIERGRGAWAAALLAASVATKYITAPLFLLDFFSAFRRGRPCLALLREALRSFGPRGLAAALVIVVAFAPFFRGWDFFASTAGVQRQSFFLPSDALKALTTLAGLGIPPLVYLVELVFPVIAVFMLVRYWRSPGKQTFREAVAGATLALTFMFSVHLWPWYLLWYLPFAMLSPASLLGRWGIGVAIGAPFLLLVWTTNPYASDFARLHVPSLLLYGIALAWMFLAPRVFSSETAPSHRT